jgi:hypothetical protein
VSLSGWPSYGESESIEGSFTGGVILRKSEKKKRMNVESPLVDPSVLIDYFEGIDCRESTVLDKLLGKIWPGFSRYISGKSILSLPYFYDAIRRFREMDISSNLSYEGTKRRIGGRKTR